MKTPTLEQQIKWNKDFLEDLERFKNFNAALKQWEFLSKPNGTWGCVGVEANLSFFDGYVYRRKPQTRIINGFEVPTPLPCDCVYLNISNYYVVSGTVNLPFRCSTLGESSFKCALKNGFVFRSYVAALLTLNVF